MSVVLAAVVVSSSLGWLVQTFTSRQRGDVPQQLATLGVRLLCLSTLNAWLWIPAELGGQGGPKLAILFASLACVAVATVRRRWPRLPAWVIAFLVVVFISSAASSQPETSLFFALRLSLVFAVAGLAATALAASRLRVLLVEFAVLVASWLLVAMAIVPADTWRTLRAPLYRYSLDLSVVGFSRINLAALGLVLTAAAIESTRWRLPFAFAGVPMLVLPQSRAVLLGAVALLVVSVVTKWRKLLLPIAGLAVIVATLAITVDPIREVWDRERAAPEASNAFSYRTELFNASVERAKERPLLGDGIGVGNVGIEIDISRDGLTYSSHSELGMALSATGLAGSVVVAWGYLHGLRLGWRSRKLDWLPLGIIAAMLAMSPFQPMFASPNSLLLPYLLIVIPAHVAAPLPADT